MARRRHQIPGHTRRAVIERDQHRCVYCGKVGAYVMRYGKASIVENPLGLDLDVPFYNGSDVVAFHFDHIKPICRGGDNDITNIALSCQRCNESKGSKILQGGTA